MKRVARTFARARRQDGQALVLVALAMVALIGFAGLVIDIGRVWVAQRQLQSAVDAAALDAGQTLPNATAAYNAAIAYGGTGKNQVGGYGVSVSSPTVTFQCVSHAPSYNSGSCPASTPASAYCPSGCNAVHVTETATVQTTFAGLFLSSFTVSASSTATQRGSSARPVNAYVILDNTQSMTDPCTSSVTGISGTPERLDCAKAGMRALLQTLWPCSSSLSSCGSASANSGGQLGANVAAPMDEVGVLVFPAISGNPPATSTLDKEIDCSNGSSFTVTYPTWTPYTYSAGVNDGGIPSSDDYLGYQAVGLSSDYRSSVASSTLTWNSNLVESVNWNQCPSNPAGNGLYPGGDWYGLQVVGGQGSYLAGAITEAQHLLNQSARVGTTNAIIILSDGQMNNPKEGFSTTPCQDAINAATQAKAAGTVIYAIAYGSNGTECPEGKYTDLQTMQDLATSPTSFFNEPTNGSLDQAFAQVGTSLTDPRLIPDCTAAPPGC